MNSAREKIKKAEEKAKEKAKEKDSIINSLKEEAEKKDAIIKKAKEEAEMKEVKSWIKRDFSCLRFFIFQVHGLFLSK